jgi:hypothetical protein
LCPPVDDNSFSSTTLTSSTTTVTSPVTTVTSSITTVTPDDDSTPDDQLIIISAIIIFSTIFCFFFWFTYNKCKSTKNKGKTSNQQKNCQSVSEPEVDQNPIYSQSVFNDLSTPNSNSTYNESTNNDGDVGVEVNPIYNSAFSNILQVIPAKPNALAGYNNVAASASSNNEDPLYDTIL